MTHQIPFESTGLRLTRGIQLSTHPDFWVRGEENAEIAYQLSLKAFTKAAEEETKVATIATRVLKMRNALAEHEKNGKPSPRLVQLNGQATTWITRRKAATHAAAAAWHYSRQMAALWMQRRSWRVHHGPTAKAAISAPKRNTGRPRNPKGQFAKVSA